MGGAAGRPLAPEIPFGPLHDELSIEICRKSVYICVQYLFPRDASADGSTRFSNGQEDSPVNDEALLKQLEELAQRMAITVRYANITGEDSPGRGGLCRVRGEYVLIVHSRATLREKIRVVKKALKRFDLGEIYMVPALRDVLERSDR